MLKQRKNANVIQKKYNGSIFYVNNNTLHLIRTRLRTEACEKDRSRNVFDRTKPIKVVFIFCFR